MARKAENSGQFSAAVGAITALNRMMALGADQKGFRVIAPTGTTTGAKKGPAQLPLGRQALDEISEAMRN